jgi:DNA-binding transcriptional regulator LsrR (DeoR family)
MTLEVGAIGKNGAQQMKRTFSVMAVAVSMAVGATAAGAVQERIPELPRPGAADVKSITLTGCVERGTEIESYTLTEAKEGATTASNVTPRLPLAISSTDVDISKHVGHSVSVTGSYAKAPRNFTVKSLKMLASSCQQST